MTTELLTASARATVEMMTAEGPLKTLTQAGRDFPGGPVAASTIRRWAVEGIDGVRLRHVRRGGRRFTTDTAIREFLAAMNP